MKITPKRIAGALIFLAALGAVSVVAGVAMVYPPAAFIVGGAFVVAGAVGALIVVDV